MPQNILQLNADKILIRGQDRANTYTVLAHSAKQQVLDKHVKSTLQSPQKHFKDQAAKNLEIVIHGFINSRLDFCNSSLSGISITFLSCHQLIQSSAARILTLTKRHDHITSILGSPWLPVAFGSDLKLFFNYSQRLWCFPSDVPWDPLSSRFTYFPESKMSHTLPCRFKSNNVMVFQ